MKEIIEKQIDSLNEQRRSLVDQISYLDFEKKSDEDKIQHLNNTINLIDGRIDSMLYRME